MTIAEICGKLTPYECMEDLLTSDVFGTFRYLEPNQGLVPFLLRAVGFQDDNRPGFLNDIVEAEYLFWPRTTGLNREPDLLIVLTRTDGSSVSMLVEAKYHSGKSNIGREDQVENGPDDFSAQNNDHLDGDQLAELYKELKEGNINFGDNHEAEKLFIALPDSVFYLSDYPEKYKIVNYFLPLDALTGPDKVDDLIIEPLILLYDGKESEANELVKDAAVTVEIIKGL